ncbi:MAG TPA: 23S rRNA (pseudouridine(1915)-N(3))-methyltransferase RlmH [Gemmatimonadales bacterium]|jgi:23S rRNA (pseudouridine1915-N3)-methyltransferase|nr:23S rRNA (pseudouridine(1915)-N(3))-methyltransferase RlmH [Gemmatimonadales bacterium]
MMEIAILAVGKLRSFYREACDEYEKRLRRYSSFVEHEIREGRGNSAAEIEQDEARRLTERLPKRAAMIALARDGVPWSSVHISHRLQRWSLEARPLAFVIGGSTGLHKTLLSQAQHRWSLGPLTLPHELARVVVYEQLYRAFTILKGEPYHKGRS